MKKRSRFLIGFTAAAITFASLFMILGPRHFGGPFGSHFSVSNKCMMNGDAQTRGGKGLQPAQEKRAD